MTTPKRLLVRGKGSITVFLSLSGILIFALLGSLLDLARFRVCQNQGERALATATEALMTEYHRGLEDHYGMIFMETCGDSYESVINRYLSHSLEPGGRGRTSFLRQQLTDLKVVERQYAGDLEALGVQREISAMMLRKLTKEQLEKFKSKADKLAKTEKEGEKIEKKLEDEREAAESEVDLLELMELVDGIQIKKGKIHCQEDFLKMFATGKKKAQNFGVNQKEVWKKMKEKLVDVDREKDLKKRVKKALKLTDRALEIRKSLRAKKNKELNKIVESLSVLDSNKSCLEDVDKALFEGASEEKIRELWKDYDTAGISFDYTGVRETGGGEDPMKSLADSWNKGILSLVWEGKVSDQKVSQADNYAKLYREEGEEYGDRISDFSQNQEVDLTGNLGDLASYGMDEFALDQYVKKYFTSFLTQEDKSEWKRALCYQWEYLIGGKDSDAANLKAVLERILLLRTLVNFPAIYSDSAMRNEAYGAAAAVVGFTGMEFLIRLTQTLIILVWAMVESMVDIAGILQGRHVPVVKKAQDILTSFPEIFAIQGKAICSRARRFKEGTDKSFGYQEYIFLLFSSTPQSLRRYRLMDLVDQDMRKNGHKDFALGTMVFGLKVQGSFSCPAYFLRFPRVEEMLERKI
ncbi:MAG: DUF5702 domain-containing protein, partial [Eubacterium sp.]|nr:DUF5702 domain-containing protein [Eubacterium sp.]